MPRLPRPLPPYDVNADRYPDDDYYIEQWKVTMLNRIDQEWGCDVLLWWELDIYVHCGLPEHDPFSEHCKGHR